MEQKNEYINGINKPKIFSKKLIESWTLIDRPKYFGEGPDDWVLEKVPVKLGDRDLDKEIQEAAKGTSLKDLVQMCIRTGDDSILHASQGVFTDISHMPKDMMEAQNAILEGKKIFGELDPGLKAKGIDGVANMTREELDQYILDIVNKQKVVNEKKEIKEEVNDNG